MRARALCPTPERIVEDVSRIPKTVDKIVEYGGGMVPDGVLRTGRREQRAKRPFVAHPDCQGAQAALKSQCSLGRLMRGLWQGEGGDARAVGRGGVGAGRSGGSVPLLLLICGRG